MTCSDLVHRLASCLGECSGSPNRRPAEEADNDFSQPECPGPTTNRAALHVASGPGDDVMSAPRAGSREPDAAEAKWQLTHYVVVRRDLSLGVLAANLVHAAGESSMGKLPPNTRAVVLGVPDEPTLREVCARLRHAGLDYRRIVETEGPHAGQLMSLGLVPRRKEDVRRFLSSLPLLR